MERHKTNKGRTLLVGPGTCSQAVACRPQKSAMLYIRKLVRGTKYVVVQGLPSPFWTDWIPEDTAGNTMMETQKT